MVFRLQKRIYRAERAGDWRRVHKLQRLLLRSWSARCLAVRQVTQENQGKRTAGVDGVASLTPHQRLVLAHRLQNLAHWSVDPVRRVYIPKPGSTEKRGLGIPTMRDRAMQALVKQVLEPEWEAKFEPNVYGFRPGRCAQDAIGAIFNHICLKPKYVLDADIEKCFDRIGHTALLAKLRAPQPIQLVIHDWLKAGILEEGLMLFPEAGTPQGGIASPILANVALHGFEKAMNAVSQQHPVAVIRYADDFVTLCDDLATLETARTHAEAWLAEMGLRLKPSKTHITHTLQEHEGQVGFDFLGFQIRQYSVGQYHTRTYRGKPGMKTLIKPSRRALERHIQHLHTLVHRYRGANQAALIAALNPVIRGWANYYRSSVAKRIFSTADHHLYNQLYGWAHWRHSHKTGGWRYRRYWQTQGTHQVFSNGTSTLACHDATPIIRHVKIQGDKSPYNGDWVYWGLRLQHDPTKPPRVLRLLKRQHGRCEVCGLRFMADDKLEIHHLDRNHANPLWSNQVLLHLHCHDQAHAQGVNDNDPCSEEPDDGKLSCPVLERRRGGRPPRRP